MRIVALADSLALPRPEPSGRVLWEETWPYVLQQELYSTGLKADVINCGMRARTIDTILGFEFTEHVILKRPDIIILQVGIVDCSPRIFSRSEGRILKSQIMPAGLRERIIQRRSQRRSQITSRNPLAKVYTSPEKFAACLDSFQVKLKSLDWSPVIFILPIVSDRHMMETKSPGHTANVDLYNAILKSYCQKSNAWWVECPGFLPAKEGETLFCEDGVHLNVEGHRLLSRVLVEQLVAVDGKYEDSLSVRETAKC